MSTGTRRTVGPVIRRRNDEARGALIAYLPVGFPTLDESVAAAVALVENGVDVLELGLPYSDPVMDGPVIQAATQQALANGFRVSDGFEAVRRITERTDAPVLIMTYWNPVVQFGVEKFAVELKGVGGAGLITPDLIPDEAADWLEISDKFGLDRVRARGAARRPGRVPTRGPE
jgi:tryptophan synthase alpha chain